MGTFFTSPKTSPLEAQAASEPGKPTTTLKGQGPTTRKGNRDGRSYAEVVRAGPETGSMSKLQQSRASWKFVAAPTNEEMALQERLPDPGRDRQGTS